MSLTPPPTQEAVCRDIPMTEAPSMESAPTVTHQSDATADTIIQTQQHENQQQHYSALEYAPLATDSHPASTISREHPPREPTPRQPTPRQHDNTSPDRQPLHPSSYPTGPDSIPPTPHPGMSAPLAPRAHTDTPVNRTPLSSYPTAPATASQTPQLRRSQTPQQTASTAGWLIPSAASSASKITFDGTFQHFISPAVVSRPLLPEKHRNVDGGGRGKEYGGRRQGAPHLTMMLYRLPFPFRNHF